MIILHPHNQTGQLFDVEGVEKGPHILVSRRPYLCWDLPDRQHLSSHQECSAVASLPEGPQEAKPGIQPAADLLPLAHWELIDVLYHSMVCSCTMAERKKLLTVVKVASSANLSPALMDIYTCCCINRAENIIKGLVYLTCCPTSASQQGQTDSRRVFFLKNSNMHWLLHNLTSHPSALTWSDYHHCCGKCNI